MKNSSFKALYVFMTSLLGILLFGLIHRALFIIYDILGDFYPKFSILNASASTVQILDFFSLLLVIFLGGWYGVWLGFHWFHVVYEDEKFNKIFHGLSASRYFRSGNTSNKMQTEKTQTGMMPKKIFVRPKTAVQNFGTARVSTKEKTWNLEDLATIAEPETSKAKPAKKVVRKAVAKKRVTTKATAKKKAVVPAN